jgi:hypothetical protein
MTNVTLSRNRVVAIDFAGLGGALYVADGRAHIEGCSLHRNVAESRVGSFAAFAADLMCDGGNLVVKESQFAGSRAGGKGQFQNTNYGTYISVMGCKSAVFDTCVMSDDGGGDGVGDEAALDNPSDVWFRTSKHTVLRDCSLRSSTAEQKWLALAGQEVQLLVRGSRFENVGLKVDAADASRLGIVNSTFSPPLEAAILTVQPPVCGTNVAGERVCDERAQCAPALGGGVQCSCIGEGLRYKPGFPEDGRRCQQDARLSSTLESDVLYTTVKKPGNYGRPLRLNVHAEGEAPFLVISAANCTLLRGGTPSGQLALATDEPVASAFGQQIVWTKDPPGSRNVSLDGNALTYDSSTLLDFDVRMNCTVGGGECAADGDVIETVLELSSAFGGSRMSTKVTIKTAVVALVSCDNTKVRIVQDGRELNGDVVPSGSALSVHLAARDVDGLNVTASRAQLELTWGEMAVEFQRQRDGEHGSNEYIAFLPTNRQSTVSGLALVVTLLGGWSQSGGENGHCRLLERTIDLRDAPHSKLQYYVLGGSLVASALIVGLLIFLVRRHSHKLEHIFYTLISEIVVLVCHLTLEAVDLGTDIYTWYCAVIDESLGASEATKTAYSALVAIALFVGTVSVGYHIRIAFLLRHATAAQLGPAAVFAEPSTPRSSDKAMLTKLRWEVDRSRREVTSHGVTLLSVVFEDVRVSLKLPHQSFDCTLGVHNSGASHACSPLICEGWLCRCRLWVSIARYCSGMA